MKVAANTSRILRSVPLPDEVAVTHTNSAVVDMGSHFTRVGFAGDNAPRLRERTVAIRGSANGGSTSYRSDGEDADLSTLCFDRAYDRYLSGRLSDDQQCCAVMHRSGVADWDAWEQLIQRVDDIVLASHAEMNTPMLLTEKALLPVSQRQRMAEILYEKHRLNAAAFALSPVLALYASGLCTGVSVELGHQQSHVVPVFQGFSLFHATHCLDFGGNDVTELLASTSAAQLPTNTTNPRGLMDIWAYLKEHHCEALESHALFTQVMNSGRSQQQGDADSRYTVVHSLPDGSTLELSTERFVGPEGYFQPTLIPRMKEVPDQSAITEEVQLRTTAHTQPPLGIHQLIEQSVRKCDEDLVPTLYDNIVLSGGSSLFPGLPGRLEAEVQALLPSSSADRARVTADVERHDAAFVGGSILASLPTFQDLWVTKAEYDEVGSMAVVRGCF